MSKLERVNLLIHLLRIAQKPDEHNHVNIAAMESEARVVVAGRMDKYSDGVERNERVNDALDRLFDVARREEHFMRGEIGKY